MFQEALAFDDVLVIPQHSVVKSRKDVSLAASICGWPIAIPILSANMSSITESAMMKAMEDAGGLGVIHRMNTPSEQYAEIEKANCFVSCVSIGLNSWRERVRLTEEKAAKGDYFVFFLDVAHADQDQVYDFLDEWHGGGYGHDDLVIGNVATADAVDRILTKYKGDPHMLAFKVGIGSGSLCTTRIQTGCGLPTFASIYEIHQRFPNVELIADGGFKSSGDIVKALGAGANAVMLGSLLAGTYETPGELFIDDGHYFKTYRGSASYRDKARRGEEGFIEGESYIVPYKGYVKDVLAKLCDGIRSGISYAGFTSVSEFIGKANFAKVTPNGHKESYAHGLTS